MPRDDSVFANSTFTKVTTNGGTVDFGTGPVYSLSYKSITYTQTSADVIDLTPRTFTFQTLQTRVIDTGSCIIGTTNWRFVGTAANTNKYEITLPSGLPTPLNFSPGDAIAVRADAATVYELLVCLVTTAKKLRMAANNQTQLDTSGTTQDYAFTTAKDYTGVCTFRYFY